jgi:hypothetical protein
MIGQTTSHRRILEKTAYFRLVRVRQLSTPSHEPGKFGERHRRKV